MRVAFCLSGGPRFAHRGLFQMMYAIQGYEQADFFIRTWKTDQYGNNSLDFINYLQSNGMPDNCQYPVVQVLDDIPINQPPKLDLNVAYWAPNFLTMWWGVVQCNQLRKEYEKITGTTYDLVIRIRTDIIPTGTINLNDYQEVAKRKLLNAANFGDCFIVGSPQMYEKYVHFWDYLYLLSESKEFIHPEEMLRTYMERLQIPYECLPMHVQPTNQPDEYKVRNV